MAEAPVSLRELSHELGLAEPEQAILNDALDALVNEWPLEREVLRQALVNALDSDNQWLRDELERWKESAKAAAEVLAWHHCPGSGSADVEGDGDG